MEGKFLTRHVLDEYEIDGKSIDGQWVVRIPLIYRSVADDQYTVPRGFIHDLASIPRILQNVFQVNDQSRAAATLHDWLYCSQKTTRAQADALFLEAMEVRGVGWLQRQMMWAAVRSAGWIYWNKRKNGMKAEDFVGPGYFDS